MEIAACVNMIFLCQGFQKLSSDRHTYVHTDMTKMIYSAASQVVSDADHAASQVVSDADHAASQVVSDADHAALQVVSDAVLSLYRVRW